MGQVKGGVRVGLGKGGVMSGTEGGHEILQDLERNVRDSYQDSCKTLIRFLQES